MRPALERAQARSLVGLAGPPRCSQLHCSTIFSVGEEGTPRGLQRFAVRERHNTQRSRQYMGASSRHGSKLQTWEQAPDMGASSRHGSKLQTWEQAPDMGASSRTARNFPATAQTAFRIRDQSEPAIAATQTYRDRSSDDRTDV